MENSSRLTISLLLTDECESSESIITDEALYTMQWKPKNKKNLPVRQETDIKKK